MFKTESAPLPPGLIGRFTIVGDRIAVLVLVLVHRIDLSGGASVLLLSVCCPARQSQPAASAWIYDKTAGEREEGGTEGERQGDGRTCKSAFWSNLGLNVVLMPCVRSGYQNDTSTPAMQQNCDRPVNTRPTPSAVSARECVRVAGAVPHDADPCKTPPHSERLVQAAFGGVSYVPARW